MRRATTSITAWLSGETSRTTGSPASGARLGCPPKHATVAGVGSGESTKRSTPANGRGERIFFGGTLSQTCRTGIIVNVYQLLTPRVPIGAPVKTKHREGVEEFVRYEQERALLWNST